MVRLQLGHSSMPYGILRFKWCLPSMWKHNYLTSWDWYYMYVESLDNVMSGLQCCSMVLTTLVHWTTKHYLITNILKKTKSKCLQNE